MVPSSRLEPCGLETKQPALLPYNTISLANVRYFGNWNNPWSWNGMIILNSADMLVFQIFWAKAVIVVGLSNSTLMVSTPEALSGSWLIVHATSSWRMASSVSASLSSSLGGWASLLLDAAVCILLPPWSPILSLSCFWWCFYKQ